MREKGLLRRLSETEPWFWVVVPLSLVTTGIAPILLPLEVEKIEGRALHVGVVMAGIGAGMLTAPLWTRLSERWHAHRDLVVVGALAIVFGVGAFHFAEDVHEWASLAFVMGAGAAGVFTLTNLLVMRCYPPEKQHVVFGWLQTLSTVGTVAGLMMAGVITHVDWSVDVGFAIAAALALGAALYAGATLPTPPEQAPAGDVAQIAPTPVASPAARRFFPFVVLVTLWGVGNVGQGAVGALYPVLMREEFSLAPAYSSYALAVGSALSILFFLPASRMTVRFGGLSVLRGAFGARLAFLGVILGMSLLAWFSQGAQAWLVYVPFSASGLTWPFLSVSAVLMVSRLAPGHSGPGVFDAATAGAFLIGPVVGGHVADAFGYTWVWLLAIVGVAISLLLSVPLKVQRPADREAAAP